MSQLILFGLAGVILLVLGRKLWVFFVHIKIREFVFIFLSVTLFFGCIAAAYFAWKYWWPIYMAKPTVQWQDETLEADPEPYTPGIIGKPKPTEIQIR